MKKVDLSPFIYLLLVSACVGIVAGFIGMSMSDEPSEMDKTSQQLDAAIKAASSGKEAPVLTWPQPWPAEHPWMFGSIVGVSVFVIGLLIIIAANTSRSGRRVDAL